MTDFFSTPDDLGDIKSSDLQSSFMERMGAQAADAIDPKNSPSAMWLYRRAREADAGGADFVGGYDIDGISTPEQLEQAEQVRKARIEAIPDTPIQDAKARVKEEGLERHLNLPDQETIKRPVLDLMINEAHERRDRELAIARGPQGFLPDALGLITSIGAGIIDPVAMAAFSIPVLGEAKWGQLMARAGDSLINRAGVRSLQGGLQGAVGTAVLQPADWWLHTQDGQDYTMADALKSVVIGAGMGAGFHTLLGGSFRDIRDRAQGRPLVGSPEDIATQALAPPDQAPSIDGEGTVQLPPEHPAHAIADLPPTVQEDIVRTAIADITNDRPVRAADVLQIAADHDPRIAETMNDWQSAVDQLPPAGEGVPKTVDQDIYMQLRRAGVPEEEAEQHATVFDARYRTRAARLGLSPEEAFKLYKSEGIHIQDGDAPIDGGAREFAQITPARVHGLGDVDKPIASFKDDKAIKSHADYKAAKAGDAAAAFRVVKDSVDPKTVEEAGKRFGKDVTYAPVMASELTGHNALPAATAAYYAEKTGARIEATIHQANSAHHTGASAMERLAVRPHFAGVVRPGERYVLVDDVSVMGSTLAGMADHIRANGGEVAGVITLANASRTGRGLADPGKRSLFQRANFRENLPGQLDLEGTGPVSDGERAQRAANQPLKPKVAQKPMDLGLFGDEAEQGDLLDRINGRSYDQATQAPVYYSAALRAIEASSQDKAAPAQWLGLLRNATGVKADELKWLGLEDWLKQHKGAVSKADVAEYIRANQIEIKEVTKGKQVDRNPRIDDAAKINDEMIAKYGDLQSAFEKMTDAESVEYDRVHARAVEIRDAKADELYGRAYSELRPYERDLVDNELHDIATDDKYSSWQLPGGDNYRELLLTLPDVKRSNSFEDYLAVYRERFPASTSSDQDVRGFYDRGAQIPDAGKLTGKTDPDVFRSSHFDEPNILTHIRFNDRTIDGKKTLFIEEIQSDWHQAGRRQGYTDGKGLEEATKRDQEVRAKMAARYNELPSIASDGRFKTKRELLDDGDNKLYKKLAELELHDPELLKLQAEREVTRRELDDKRAGVPDAPFKTSWPELALKRMIRYAAENGYEAVAWTPGHVQADRYDLSKQIKTLDLAIFPSGEWILNAFGHDGRRVMRQDVNENNIADYIGKDAAERLLKQPERHGVKTLDGQDLRIGGEGMSGFYDKILPTAADKLLKKFEGKVKPAELKLTEDGRPRFDVVDTTDDGHGRVMWSFDTREAAERQVQLDDGGSEVREISGDAVKVHAIDINPKIRKAALEEGFPLFQGAGEGAPRGRITLSDNKAIIQLFKDRNESTFMHEAGHLWLDEMVRDAARPEAPESIKRDLKTILKWLDVKKPEDIGVKQHEQWARGFEQYLADGNAPSTALKTAFARFKAWLTEIYRNLTDLGAPIPKEIKGVMDRMLATDEEIAAARAKAKPKVADEKQARLASLSEFLARNGGLAPHPELEAIYDNNRGPFVPGAGPLIRRSGRTLDDAYRLAKENGYAHDAGDVTGARLSRNFNDMLSALAEEHAGRNQYRDGEAPPDRYDPEQEKHVILGQLESELDGLGYKVSDIDPKLLNRTVEIVHEDGVSDVIEAYERATMEDLESYDAIARARRADAKLSNIPGWDVPVDAGPTSGGGAHDPGRSGEAGSPNARAREANGAQPLDPRGRDRAAADPRWQRLADARSAIDDPELVADSKAADRLREPDSLVPEKSLTALEKAAADAREVWKRIEPSLSERDRELANQVFNDLKLDKETRDKLITDGVACLTGKLV